MPAAPCSSQVAWEGRLGVVVQIRKEVARRHRVKAWRDEVTLGEGTRVVVLCVDEVVPWLLISAHDDVDTLAKVQVEPTNLYGPNIIAAIDRDECHVVPGDCNLEVLSVAARHDPSHTVARVRLHGDQREWIRTRTVAIHAVEAAMPNIGTYIIAGHGTFELQARGWVTPLVRHEDDKVLVVCKLVAHGVIFPLDDERAADAPRALHCVHVTVVIVCAWRVCLEPVCEALTREDGSLRYVPSAIHVGLTQRMDSMPMDRRRLGEEPIDYGDL
mmetsp:Transcript_54307/g.140238  ORF Transcript_54307/g.140238 Transcript_54307/m.140238 type:complete len:272 (-) Transcript_54307:295-1110(-)